MLISTAIRDRLIAGLMLLWACSFAQAANLSINPIRITLSDNHSIGALTLINNGEEPVVLQTDVRGWDIVDNEDRYQETDLLIVTPPVFTIPPGQKQVVRVGQRRPVAGSSEQAFRVFLEQAPATPADDSSRSNQPPTGIQVTLRFGIPVFIAPDTAVNRNVEWLAQRIDHSHLRIEAANRGNVHMQVKKLALIGTDDKPLAENNDLTYLLPGTARRWVLQVPETETVTAPYRIKAWTRDGELETEIKTDRQ